MAALRDLTRYRLGFRIAVAAATIGVIYGYDLGNISGALLFIDKAFGLSTKETEWVATIVVVVANLIIGLYFLSALEALGGTATFAMFAALALVAFVFVWWLAPETKGRPLEAIRAYWENGGRWPEPATAAAGEPRFTRAGAGTPPAAERPRERPTTTGSA